jgi:hypothetical protein
MRHLRNKKRGLRSQNASEASYAPLGRPKHARTGTEDIALFDRPPRSRGPTGDAPFRPPPAPTLDLDDEHAFNPYTQYRDDAQGHDDLDAGAPRMQHASVDAGYGGGNWTYDDVMHEEKEHAFGSAHDGPDGGEEHPGLHARANHNPGVNRVSSASAETGYRPPAYGDGAA